MTINYNVTGSQRKELVGAIASKTGHKAKYMGMPSMAYEIGPYTVDKNGVLFWAETVAYSEIEHLAEQLAAAGFEAESEEAVESLNITVPYNWKSAKNRQNLQNIIKAKNELLKKSLSLPELPDVIFNTDETITFPWFKANSNPEEVHAYSALCIKICKSAQDATRVNSTEKIADNEKYAFRCFLLRLGFIGDEFKTDRKILLKNFTGSSAFKSGHKKEVEA